METKSTFQEAVALQQQGDFKKAKQLLLIQLNETPDDIQVLDALAVSHAQLGDLCSARTYLLKALAIAPTHPQLLNHLGNVYRAQGDFEHALRAYREALRERKDYPEALNNLGALYYRQGKWSQAQDIFEKVLRLDPKARDAMYNLANVLVRQDNPKAAADWYARLLSLSPEHLGAHHNLGILLVSLGLPAQARPHLEKALIADTPMLDAHYHLALVLTALEEEEEAIALYEKVLAHNASHAHAHHNIATLKLGKRSYDQALFHFKRAYALNANNTTALHFINALTRTETPAPPEGYVRDLFDFYAANYDEHVKHKLAYAVPAALRSLLSPYRPKQDHLWFGIDLGCGTGICAPYFNDLVWRLVGIDLSPRMLEKAKQTNAYHRLHEGDIVSVLEKYYPQKADILIAADVFVYFGNLEPVFQACFHALKPGGYFVFSVEDNNKEDWQLEPTGRYSHNQALIEATAQQTGFQPITFSSTSLREQEGAPLPGLLVLLQKPALS